MADMETARRIDPNFTEDGIGIEFEGPLGLFWGVKDVSVSVLQRTLKEIVDELAARASSGQRKLAEIYRQGELNFRSLTDEEVANLVSESELTEEPFVHAGETGKKHTVSGKGVKRTSRTIRTRSSRSTTVIKAPSGASVSHEQHDKVHGGPINLPPGNYEAYTNRTMGGWGAGPD